jgi:hypothetical protein
MGGIPEAIIWLLLGTSLPYPRVVEFVLRYSSGATNYLKFNYMLIFYIIVG